jgi:hypothetical protein
VVRIVDARPTSNMPWNITDGNLCRVGKADGFPADAEMPCRPSTAGGRACAQRSGSDIVTAVLVSTVADMALAPAVSQYGCPNLP